MVLKVKALKDNQNGFGDSGPAILCHVLTKQQLTTGSYRRWLREPTLSDPAAWLSRDCGAYVFWGGPYFLSIP